MRWSLRYQWLLPLALLLLGVAGVATWTALGSAHRAWRQTEARMRETARILSSSHFPLTASVLEQARGLSGAEMIFEAPDGRRIATLAEIPPLLGPFPPPAGDWPELQPATRVQIRGEIFFAAQLRLGPPRSETAGTLTLLYPESLWRDAEWEAIRPSLVLGGFFGLTSVAVALAAGRQLIRRILTLERHTRAIAAGDFRPGPLSGRNDELRDLAQAINDMARRLGQLQTAVQTNERLRLLGQVSGGLAHQLRNGVTGAILAVQLHARECPGGAEAEALTVALRQLALVEANLKRYLDLGGERPMQKEPCSLTALVEEAVTLLRPRCRHAGIALEWTPPADAITIMGDAGQLGHLFLNVLTNAVDAAGPGGRVVVRFPPGLPAGRCGVIEIGDSGPGPSQAMAPQLFEPFATDKEGGVGLGLAVARQAVQAHGGTLDWRREDGLTWFRIDLSAVCRLGQEVAA